MEVRSRRHRAGLWAGGDVPKRSPQPVTHQPFQQRGPRCLPSATLPCYTIPASFSHLSTLLSVLGPRWQSFRPPDFPPEGLFCLHEAAVTRPPAARSYPCSSGPGLAALRWSVTLARLKRRSRSCSQYHHRPPAMRHSSGSGNGHPAPGEPGDPGIPQPQAPYHGVEQ